MTSVQNHHPPLSGNKFALLVLLLTSLLALSCASSKPSSRVLNPTRTKPTASKPKVDPNKVDTVSWTVLDEDTYPPISNEMVIETNPLLRPIRNVSMLIPFEANGSNPTLSRSEEKFGHFYAGTLVAIEELEELDQMMNISVFDTGRDENKVRRILQNMDVRQSDVIVGPYETQILKAVANWGQQNEIPVVSPWRSSSNIAENNLYYYQVRPLIEQYFESILRDALSKYSPENIFIINEESTGDDSRVRALHRIHEMMNRGKISTPLSEYPIVMDSIQKSDFMLFDSLLMDHPKAALIIPNYSSRDSRYVYSLIRKLNAEIDEEEIEIYGMPTLVNARRLDLEFFRSLDLNTVDFKYIDPKKKEVVSFIQRYLDKFGHLPTEDSYHGYDIIMLLANNSNFAINRRSSELFENIPLLSMGVSFQRYHKDRLANRGLLPSRKPGDFMVNSNLKLIEFHNNRFRAVPIR
jgi:hypothetical protein